MTNQGEEKRERILAYARAEVERTGRFPSLEQIGDAVGIASRSNTWMHMQVLVRRGEVVKHPWFKTRSIYSFTPTVTERRITALALQLITTGSDWRKEELIDEMRDVFYEDRVRSSLDP